MLNLGTVVNLFCGLKLRKISNDAFDTIKNELIIKHDFHMINQK